MALSELDLKGLHVTNRIQLMAFGLENVTAVVLKPCTSAGSGETTRKGCVTAIHEVHALVATCIIDDFPSGARRYPTCPNRTWQHTGRTYGLHSWPSENRC